MPIKKQTFTNVYDNLAKIIDVDDSRGRSVPTNMNFIEEGFLSKDTGCSYFGDTDASTDIHSIFVYKKKSGTRYILRAKGTKLQVYNTGTGVFDNLTPTYTAGAKFGFVVYDDNLYGCNGVEDFFKWDGTTFTTYASAPKGNILEIFEDRMFVAGVTAEPLTIYYTDAGTVTTFPGANVLKPLGTDSVKALENYYGTMMIFKKDSIWKLTFVYDQVATIFVPKLEVQSGTYGACSRKAVSWVENDLWFFTGREVRSIGYKDQQIGILGVNQSVISETIKETLYTIPVANLDNVATFYYDRRFYLSVPLSATTNDTTFVCHTLHGNSWTKYTDRIKAKNQDYMEIDGVVYSASSVATYGIMKWDTTLLNDISTGISAEVLFDRFEDSDFNRFAVYRYLDLMFKDLQARITVTVKTDANNGRTTSTNTFIIGSETVSELMALGEVPVGSMLYGDSYGYSVTFSAFQKKRVSFLEKGQSMIVGLSNGNAYETFTLAQIAVTGHREPREMIRPSNIVSV